MPAPGRPPARVRVGSLAAPVSLARLPLRRHDRGLPRRPAPLPPFWAGFVTPDVQVPAQNESAIEAVTPRRHDAVMCSCPNDHDLFRSIDDAIDRGGWLISGVGVGPPEQLKWLYTIGLAERFEHP